MNETSGSNLVYVVMVIIGVVLIGGLAFGVPAFNRYQNRQEASNQVSINEIKIRQQEQLIQVEKQKAEIRIVEAGGIAESQRIINATLTDKYLQHEAIQAQESLANSPNHTTIYIPSGQNGIPLVKTVDEPVEP
jgi:hypothetical protein